MLAALDEMQRDPFKVTFASCRAFQGFADVWGIGEYSLRPCPNAGMSSYRRLNAGLRRRIEPRTFLVPC